MKRAVILPAVLVISFAAVLFAPAEGNTDAGKPQPKAHQTSGTVRSVDAANGRAVISHAPIQALNWPAMTMSFSVKDRKLLESLKPGKTVNFQFVQQGVDHVITSVK